MKKVALLWCVLGSVQAHAFCGTYVGGVGANLYNSSSQVAIVRQGSRMTLTMASNVTGDLTDFALVVPVPAVLGEDDVRTVNPAIFNVLDQYSAPREVTYSCEDFYWEDEMNTAGGVVDTGAVPSEGVDGGVTVEASFSVGVYDIVILSAVESTGLLTWLTSNGYDGLDETAEALLGDYIDEGQFFFAAKVDVDLLVDGADYLEPLQVSYDTAEGSSFTLPIRLGTANAPPGGMQDLFIYVLNSTEQGQARISNYPEIVVEDECMWRVDDYPNFQAWWAEQLDDARAGSDAAGWVMEYSWATGSCDPCSGEPPNEEQTNELGWDGSAWDTFFTRIHMQYTPEQVIGDVGLYHSNNPESSQIRYIQYQWEMEDQFPICGEATPDEPGTCDDVSGDADESGGPDADADADADADSDADADADTDSDANPVQGTRLGGMGDGDEAKAGCGCATPADPFGALAWFGVLLGWSRRRR